MCRTRIRTRRRCRYSVALVAHDDGNNLGSSVDDAFPRQDALASFDFLNKRNSVAVNPDLDREAQEALQHAALELTALHKDADIRYFMAAGTRWVPLLRG